ncbi:hypothetical protein FACS1894162_6460 [Bacteroidia bacterium]|nr:hypothetical protein FACS1894162_6460 [Bacteroidia bacterium]
MKGEGQRVWLSTAYLAPVEYYCFLANAPEVIIEAHEHYVKQSYRNRCVIASANGLQTLSIPVEKLDRHSREGGKQRSAVANPQIRDIRIADHGDWQHLHWNALVSAYRSSPFFEYYEDDFRPFYEKRPKFLFDFNEQLRELVCSLLGIESETDIVIAGLTRNRMKVKYSTEYRAATTDELDLRELIHPKKPAIIQDFQPYYQVFEQKYGFQPNLSIVDLLFNMGQEAIFSIVC